MKMRVWRIYKPKYRATAFSGQGAAIYPGRWNSSGTKVVYTSQNISLVALELLVHLDASQVLLKYEMNYAEFDDSLLKELDVSSLPSDWQAEPPRPSTQAIGDAWVTGGPSLALAVPSVVVPSETNILINPMHADFGRVTMGKPRVFPYDPRLLKTT